MESNAYVQYATVKEFGNSEFAHLYHGQKGFIVEYERDEDYSVDMYTVVFEDHGQFIKESVLEDDLIFLETVML